MSCGFEFGIDSDQWWHRKRGGRRSRCPDASNLLNAAVVALSGFELHVTATPIGMLKISNASSSLPAGIERGELIATIPLAPLEKTAVVHKEWSVTTKELTSIVSDELENFSELRRHGKRRARAIDGVPDGARQSVQHQRHGDRQLRVCHDRRSPPDLPRKISSRTPRRTAGGTRIGMTRKASTRVKSEHKVTISTTTVTGTSETSTRVLENPSATDRIRIDYFSMLRRR